MKSLAVFVISAVSFVVYSFSGDLSTYRLDEAMSKDLIKCVATGTGNYSGSSMLATVKNKSDKKLFIRIPPGMIFQPADTGMQDLLIVREALMVLEPGASRTVELQGFCCRSSNRAPSAGISFKPIKTSDPRLTTVAEFINSNKFSPDAIQSAVWCISDKHSVADIYAEDPSSIKPLRDEVCKLTGEKDVWYSSQVEHKVNEQGYIEAIPVEVSGSITITLNKATKVKQVVYKADGEVMWAPNADMTIPHAGTISYKFRLEVKGWEKGNYYVLVTDSNKTLLKQSFSI